MFWFLGYGDGPKWRTMQVPPRIRARQPFWKTNPLVLFRVIQWVERALQTRLVYRMAIAHELSLDTSISHARSTNITHVIHQTM
jgi:hypothetical protein